MSVNQSQAVSELRGLGGGRGGLQKLTIYYEKDGLLAQEAMPRFSTPARSA